MTVSCRSGGERQQVGAGELGQAQARQQRRHEPGHLEPQAQAACPWVAVEPAALGEQRGEAVDGRHRQPEGLGDLLLGELGPGCREQLEDVEAAGESPDRILTHRNLLPHIGSGYSTTTVSPRQSQPLDAGTPGARPVRVIATNWVDPDDGVRLAVRLWLPEDASPRPVSAILDSVPYRRSDGTAIGDAAWGTYFAAHGSRSCASTCAAAATPAG